MTAPGGGRVIAPLTIVFSDANVLYSRVLRDYLLYATVERVISVRWSQTVLDEMTKHLKRNVKGFNDASATALVAGMSDAFPYALVEPDVEHYRRLQGVSLPDKDDRHVVAATLAAESQVLCTSNVKDFPSEVMSGLKGATDASTLDALVRADAPRAAEQMAQALSMVLVRTHVRNGHVVHAYLRRR